MADVAAGDGPVPLERAARMPMALEAKSVKLRLGPFGKVRAPASMTFDA